jgi:CheY-like chemotaxis protein
MDTASQRHNEKPSEQSSSLIPGRESGVIESAEPKMNSYIADIRDNTRDAALDALMMSKATFALIDDDPTIRRSMRRVLAGSVAEVKTFESALEFLAAFYDEKTGQLSDLPDVICSDTNMNGMTGDQLFAKIIAILDELKVPDERRPVLIAMSGKPQDPENAESRKFYDDHKIMFFAKPFTMSEMLAGAKTRLKKSEKFMGN